MGRHAYVKAVGAALAVMAAFAGVAMAAQPRPGVNLHGKTSWTGGNDPVSYVFLQVSSSGKRVASMNVPAACGLTPPAVRRFAISSTGSFSGKRVLRDSGHGGDVTYTIRISGRFTAPTKAHGTYSLSFTYASGKSDEHCHTGSRPGRRTTSGRPREPKGAGAAPGRSALPLPPARSTPRRRRGSVA